MVTDPISDMLIQLKNASRVGKASIEIPASKMKTAIAKVLMAQGYLTSVTNRGKKMRKYLVCEIAYTAGVPKLTDVKRVSKPSRRVYTGANEIKPVRQGFGLMVLSTPNGLLTDSEAREAKVGGEVLFTLW